MNSGFANGTVFRVGDVMGAGTKMGIGAWEHVKRLKETFDFWDFLGNVWKEIPYFFWLSGFFLHYAVVVATTVPFAAKWFEGEKVCRFHGIFPTMCREYGPHWALVVLKVGSKGMFLVVSSLGLAMKLMVHDEQYPVLSLHRGYLFKVSLGWVIVMWLLPGIITDGFLPVNLVLSLVVAGSKLTGSTYTISVVAMVMSRYTGVPVIACYLAMDTVYANIKHKKYVGVGSGDTVMLSGWLADVFGNCTISVHDMRVVQSVLASTTKEEYWAKVRVFAYMGDKLCYFHNALVGYKQGLDVGEVQLTARTFDDVCLRSAMQYYASDWWKNQNESMKGKAASTVLEAVSYAVLNSSSLSMDVRLGIIVHYKSAIDRVQEHIASRGSDMSSTKESSGVDTPADSEFVDC